MFVENINKSEDYYDDFVSAEMSYNDKEFNDELTQDSIDFADGMFSIFQEIIDEEDRGIKEQFTSEPNAVQHFNRHCLRPNRSSRRSSVYYDFTKLSDYLSHEDKISRMVIEASHNPKYVINDLTKEKETMKAFRTFFEGGKSLVLGLPCGFTNENGSVRVCLHSWATDYTTNYRLNTVDFLIQSPDNKTITIYPLDANYLENKINSMIRDIPSLNGFQLKINH